MKVIDIALKDMLRYFRSTFALGMMLVVPLLITGLIYAAFGGVLSSSETEEYSLPAIQLQVVNHDAGDVQSGLSAGQYLVDALTSEAVKNVFAVTISEDEQAARSAVDRQEAAVAILIPENFSRAAASGTEKAALVLYQDPTLEFGPGITREILDQFLDALNGGRIASQVLAEQFEARGLGLDPSLAAQAQADYAGWFAGLAGARSWNLPLLKRLPNNPDEKSVTDHRNSLMGPVMAGMMIFFVFFTGANSAQMIIKEQEEGTLARMFTTPTPPGQILAGKFSAVFLVLVVQSLVLVAASSLVFGIDWGSLPALAMMVAGLVASSTGFGILLMSLIKTTRQAGPVTGGVLTLTGMAGGLMTTGLQGVPAALDSISLGLPQGWALRGLRLVLFGGNPADVLMPFLVLLAFGLVFFTAGALLFRRRFV